MKNQDLFNDYIKMVDKIIEKHFYNIKDKDIIRQEGYILLFDILSNKDIYSKKTFLNYINMYMFFAILNRCALNIDNFTMYEDRVVLSNLLINTAMKHTNKVPDVISIAKKYSLSKKTAKKILMYSYNDYDDINISVSNGKKYYCDYEDDLINALDNKKIVRNILDSITTDERREIIKKQFGLTADGYYTFKEIGRSLGVSKQSVNFRSLSEIKRLRKTYKNTLQNN